MPHPDHIPEPGVPAPGETGEPLPDEPVGKPSDEDTEEQLDTGVLDTDIGEPSSGWPAHPNIVPNDARPRPGEGSRYREKQ